MPPDSRTLSPDKRMKKFVGHNGRDNLMISAIKQDKIGLPGQDSDGELDFVVEESCMINEDDLNDLNLQSPFFENL